MFVVDMHAPGVTVRPLRQMAGGVGLQRGLLRRRPHPRQRAARRARRGLAGRADHADERAGGHRRRRQRPRRPGRGAGRARPRPAARSSTPDRRCSPGRPWAGRSSSCWPPATPATGGSPCSARAACPGPRPAPASSPAPPPRGSAADAGVRLLGDDAVYAADRRRRRHLAAHPGLPARAGDRRRHRPGAAQHPRRAGARAAAGTAGRQDGPVLDGGGAMNFDLDTDQRDAAAGRARSSSPARRPRPPPAPRSRAARSQPGRKALADIGFLGITVAEAAGGAGGSLLDLAVVAEQGGAVLAGPSLVTAARAAVLLADVPELAAQLADGSAAFAVVDGDRAAPSIDAAERHLVPRPGGRRAGRRRRRGDRRRADRRHPRAGLGAADRPAGAGRGRRASCGRGPGRSARSSSPPRTSGAADRAVQLGVALRQGAAGVRPADRLVPGGQAHAGRRLGRASTSCARWCGGRPGPPTPRPTELPLAASAAKAYAARVFEQAAETLIQVHGGIGFTWEHDAHLYWRRAKVDRLLLGDEAEHLDAVARRRRRPARLDGSARAWSTRTERPRTRWPTASRRSRCTGPTGRNAFTGTMADELARAAGAADADDDVRVVAGDRRRPGLLRRAPTSAAAADTFDGRRA